MFRQKSFVDGSRSSESFSDLRAVVPYWREDHRGRVILIGDRLMLPVAKPTAATIRSHLLLPFLP